MKTFTELHSQWIRFSHNDSDLLLMLEEKIPSLLNHSEEGYVKQGMEILLQFEALASILEEKNGSIQVLNKYGDNRIAVEKCVIEEVSQSQSQWIGLFESGSFDGMLPRAIGNTEWSELSDSVQHRLLTEVKQMVEIEPCTFMMGALEEDEEAWGNEKPRHAVTLTRKYSIGKYPVTQALWERVMGNNPSGFKGSSRPVELVSWFECVDFCNKLSEMEGLEKAYLINGEDVQCNFDADGYRLPTEAEWECAGRGGESHLYSGSNNIDDVVWYSKNSNYETHGVGQKKANGFGLFDMSGNVQEWCWDWDKYYSSAPTEDPTGATTGTGRAYRGGRWYDVAVDSRLSLRYRRGPSLRDFNLGFRLCRTILKDSASEPLRS